MTLYYSELRVIFTLKLDKEPFRGGTTVMIEEMVNMFICGASSGLNIEYIHHGTMSRCLVNACPAAQSQTQRKRSIFVQKS